MTDKLPVKTFKLKKRKRVGLILFICVELLLTLFFLRLGLGLERNFGRMICSVLFLSSLVVLAFAVFALIRLIRENFVGFFISGDGLNDISTGHDIGVVMWRDVVKIRVVDDIESARRKYIVLKVHNPQAYIDREASHIKRRSMTLKLHYYGSPICFSERAIECTFEELEANVRRYYDNYQQREKEHLADMNSIPL